MKNRKRPYKSKSGGLFTKSDEIAKSSEISIVKRKEDIINFPRLKDAGPAIFVHEYPKRLLDVDELVHNEQFISQKYYTFLKRILIDDLNYMEIAKATVTSEPLREQLVADKIERTFLLKTALISIPEFRQYINQNPSVIEQIIKEFREFNDEIRKKDDKPLMIDTQKVYSKFLDLARICKGPSVYLY